MMKYDEVELGMKVDYHSNIDGPITKRNCTVRSNPWMLGHGEWVVLITGMSGSVSLNAISKTDAKSNRNKETVYDEDIKPLMSRIIKTCIEYNIPVVAEYHIPIDEHPDLCVSTGVIEDCDNIPIHMLTIMALQQARRTKPYIPKSM